MNKLTRALLVCGALAVSHSAFAVTGNDLYMGFQNQAGGGTEDYIINLGLASGIVGQTSVIDLSGDFSLSDFNAVLGSSSSMFGGVIGANNANNPSDVYLTQLRVGGAGSSPATAGSNVGATMTRSQDNSTFAVLGSLANPAAGTGTLDTSKSWENVVEPTFTTGSFYGQTGINPDSAVSPSTVLYEDLWLTSSSSSVGAKPYAYEGYFTLDLTGSQPSLTFTGANVVTAVPEPATYGLLSGAGLLLLSLRRKLTGQMI